MILTYKLRHGRDFSKELKQAFQIAGYVVDPVVGFSRYSFPGGKFSQKRMIQKNVCRSSKVVKNIGLPSAISNQILKKYGNQKTIKEVHKVNLVVPNQSIKVDKENKTITIVPLKLVLKYQFPEFEKVNQIELGKEYAHISVTLTYSND